MNKILFKFLVVGFALANIQGASAVKPTNDTEERDPNRTPRKVVRLSTPRAPKKLARLNFPPLRDMGVVALQIRLNGVVIWDPEEAHFTSSSYRSKRS